MDGGGHPQESFQSITQALEQLQALQTQSTSAGPTDADLLSLHLPSDFGGMSTAPQTGPGPSAGPSGAMDPLESFQVQDAIRVSAIEAKTHNDAWASGRDPWQPERPSKTLNTGVGKGPHAQHAAGASAGLPQSAKGANVPHNPIGPLSTSALGTHPAWQNYQATNTSVSSSSGLNGQKDDSKGHPVLVRDLEAAMAGMSANFQAAIARSSADLNGLLSEAMSNGISAVQTSVAARLTEAERETGRAHIRLDEQGQQIEHQQVDIGTLQRRVSALENHQVQSSS